jgi:hypothetical protein
MGHQIADQSTWPTQRMVVAAGPSRRRRGPSTHQERNERSREQPRPGPCGQELHPATPCESMWAEF